MAPLRVYLQKAISPCCAGQQLRYSGSMALALTRCCGFASQTICRMIQGFLPALSLHFYFAKIDKENTWSFALVKAVAQPFFRQVDTWPVYKSHHMFESDWMASSGTALGGGPWSTYLESSSSGWQITYCTFAWCLVSIFGFERQPSYHAWPTWHWLLPDLSWLYSASTAGTCSSCGTAVWGFCWLKRACKVWHREVFGMWNLQPGRWSGPLADLPSISTLASCFQLVFWQCWTSELHHLSPFVSTER